MSQAWPNRTKEVILEKLNTYYSSLRVLRDRRVLILSVSNVLDRMSESIIVPLLPIYATQIGMSPLLLGVMFALPTGVRTIFSPICGYLSDKLGKKRFISGGMLLGACSVIALAFVTSPMGILALRALDGFAAAMRNAPTTTYLGDITDDDTRPEAMAVYSSTGTLGATFGPVIGGATGALGSLSLPFLLLGLCTLLGGVLLAVYLPTLNLNREASDILPDISVQDITTEVDALFVAFSLSALLAGMGLGATSPIIAPYLKQTIDAGPLYMGLFWGGFSIALTVLTPIGGTYTNSFGKVRGILTGKFIWVVVVFAVAFFQYWYVPILMYVIGAIGTAISGPAVGTLQYETAPDEKQGSIIGVYSMFGSAGLSIGPVAAGAFASATSYQLAFIVVGVLYAVDVLVLHQGFSMTDKVG